MLEKQGYRVTAVVNGSSAVRAVQQEAFDVVLMDVQMPDMNGLEATRAIRGWEQQHGGHVPIIAMSAHAMNGTCEECLQAGMDEYLPKPVQIPDLLRIVTKVTKREKEQSETILPVQFDPLPLLKRINDDSDLLRELIHLFQEDCPLLLETLRSAVNSGDAKSVEQTAHLLKGAVSNFAAVDLMQAAHQLELVAQDGDLHKARDVFRGLEQLLNGFRTGMEEWLAAHSV